MRPIVSCSDALQENPSAFVQYQLKKVSNQHAIFLQDTPDFIKKEETFNDENKLTDNTLLVTTVHRGGNNISKYKSTTNSSPPPK